MYIAYMHDKKLGSIDDNFVLLLPQLAPPPHIIFMWENVCKFDFRCKKSKKRTFNIFEF